ncbi:MAG: autotransporter-associated beta strand repeat-containing protein, partial [Chthoniobacteraceae bacterium]
VYGYPAFSNTTYVQWDAGAMGGISDGGGDWSATNKWWNGATNQNWADNLDAVIGNYGVPGTITVTNTSPQFNSLTLNPVAYGNYGLTGNPLRIASGTINANAATTISNNITGLAALAKNGIATLTLAASNNFPGVAAINQGTVKVSHPNALGTSSAVIQSGATLDINGQSLGNGRGSLIVAGNGVGGNGAIINSGATQIQAMTNLAMTADTTVSTVNTWHLRSNPASGLDMGGHTLTKIGGNQLYIQLWPGLVQNPGNVIVSNGNFMIGFNTWTGSGATNTMTFHSGTTFQIYKGSANYVFSTVLNGATLLFSPEAAFTGNWTGGIALSGTSTIKAETNVTLNGVISGSGNLVKTGTGTLTLGGTNTYYGTTTVSNGTLRVANANFAPNSTIAVATNSVLQLNLAVTNTIANLVLNGVSQPLGVYGSNNTAYITGPGSLRVGTAIPTTPTNLNYAYSNNVLTLSWPANYLGWSLQAQTSSLAVGLSTNWFTLPGSALVTSTNFYISTTNAAVFYRLFYQP